MPDVNLDELAIYAACFAAGWIWCLIILALRSESKERDRERREAAIDDGGFNERAEQAYHEGVSLKQFLDVEAARAKEIAEKERRAS